VLTMLASVRRASPERDETGAIAVMAALMAMVILGMAAVAIDMGQVYAKRASLQSAVDQAVLAAAAKIDGTTGPCTPDAQSTAKNFLISNWIDQGGDPKAVSDINLTGSAADGNGYMTCTGWRVDLWAPAAKVNLGLAKAVSDETEINVPAHAAAEIKSPNLATLPMYIAQSCISGSQVQITDPPKGHSDELDAPDFPETGATTTLKFSNSWSDTRFLDEDIAAGNTAIKVQLQGNKYVLGDIITFTSHEDLTTTYSHTVSTADVDKNATTFNLPADVAASSGIWWVRINRGGVFMQDNEARAITIGDIGLCNGSLSGNFGTLNIARSQPDHELVKNIILGAEPFLTINANPTVIPCPVAQSETTPISPTDCVSTKPGFPGSELTNGLIHGADGLDGRLDAPTTPGCSRDNDNSQTPGTYALNDDTIACYLLHGATLSNVLYPSTTVDALSGAIVASPRFFRIPILPEDPTHGTSTNYPILGYRYVFITTEGTSSISGYNGLTMRSNGTKIETLSMAILNEDALPDTVPHPGDVVDYTGSGPKVIVLVD
jgi:hypothetical protein